MTVYFNPVACSKPFHPTIDSENSSKTGKNSLITTNIKRYNLLRRQAGNMFDKAGFIDEGNIVHSSQPQHLLITNTQDQ